MKTARGIYNNHIVTVLFSVLNARLCNFYRGDLRTHRENGYLDRFTYDLKLVDSGRSVYVAGNEQGILALLLIHISDLCRVGGFTRALKTDHHNYRGRLGADVDLRRLASHQLDKLLVYYLNYLLRGKKAFKHLCANGALRHRSGEFLNYLKVNVSLEQCELYLAQTLLDVRLGELSLVPKLFESVCKLIS